MTATVVPKKGRPKGVTHTNQLAPSPNTEAKRKITARLMEQVEEMKISPLEVMLHTMKLFYDQGQKALTRHEKEKDEDKRSHFMAVAKLELSASSQVAEKVAPYIHAKLQAVTIKGDKENPLELGVKLSGLSDVELRTMESLLSKAVMREEDEAR